MDEAHEAAERHALLAREVDHRAKNALAVVQAIVRLTRAPDQAAYVAAVEARVAALVRAHALIAGDRWVGAPLAALVQGELAPFLAAGAGAPRAEAEGPRLTLAPAAAQALSMALHELATNATKHGALSAPEGRVSVAWGVDDAAGVLRLRWAEAGGPPVAGPPTRRGFGARVIEGTVRGQLGGRVSRRWERTGLICDIEAPLAQAVAAGDRGAAAGTAAERRG